MLMFPSMMAITFSFMLTLVSASRDQANGALSPAAVPRVCLGQTAPPLCRCAERTIDLILEAWWVFTGCALTLFAARALGLSGVATSRRSPKGGGQSRSQSAQVSGRKDVQTRQCGEFHNKVATLSQQLNFFRIGAQSARAV
jgi:hypothetical protein